MYMYSISMKVNKCFFYSTLTNKNTFYNKILSDKIIKSIENKIKLEKIKHINKSYEMPESHSAKPFIVKYVIKKN